MELSDALERRSSCRSYSNEAVDPAVLDAVLAAALTGPTAGNAWALDIVVLVGDQTSLYWDCCLPEPRRSGFRWPGLLSAPVLLFPAVRPAAYLERYAESDKAVSGLGESLEDWPVPYWWVDAGAGIMAMLLTAGAHGLGSLLFGLFDRSEEMAKVLDIPGDRQLAGVIALGHPDGRSRPSISARRGRPSHADITHMGSW